MSKLLDANKWINEYVDSLLILRLDLKQIMIKLTDINRYWLQIWHVAVCELILLAEKENFWTKLSEIVSYFSPAVLVYEHHALSVFGKCCCASELALIVFG